MSAYQPPRLHQLDPNLVRRSIADQLRDGDTTGFTRVGRSENVEFLKQNTSGRVFAHVLQDVVDVAKDVAADTVVSAIKEYTGDAVGALVTDNNPLFQKVKQKLDDVTQVVSDDKVQDERFERKMHGMNDVTGPHERDTPHLPFPTGGDDDDGEYRYEHEIVRVSLRMRGKSDPNMARPTEDMHQAALRIDDAFNYNKPDRKARGLVDYTLKRQAQFQDGANTRPAAIERASRVLNATIDEDLSTSAGVVHVEEDGRITISLRGRDGSNPHTRFSDTLNVFDVLRGHEPRKVDAALQMIEGAFEKYGHVDTLNAYSMGSAITESLVRTYPELMAKIGTIHHLNPFLGPRDTFGHTLKRPNTQISVVEGDLASVALMVHAGKNSIDKLNIVPQTPGLGNGHDHKHFMHSDEHGNVLPRSVSEVEQAIRAMAKAIDAHRANPTRQTRAAGVNALRKVKALTQQHAVIIEQLLKFERGINGPRQHSPEAIALMLSPHTADPNLVDVDDAEKVFQQYADTLDDPHARAGVLRETEAKGMTMPFGIPAERGPIYKTPAHLKPLTIKQEVKKGGTGLVLTTVAEKFLNRMDPNMPIEEKLGLLGAVQGLGEGAYRGKVAAGGARAAVTTAAGRSTALMAVGAELGPAIAATFAGYYSYEMMDFALDGYKLQHEGAALYAGGAAGLTAGVVADTTTIATGVAMAAMRGARLGAAFASVAGPEAWLMGMVIGAAIGTGIAVGVDAYVALTGEEEDDWYGDTEASKIIAGEEAQMLRRFMGGDDARILKVDDDLQEKRELGVQQKHAEVNVVRSFLEQVAMLDEEAQELHLDGTHEGKRGVEQQLQREMREVGTHGVHHTTRGPNTSLDGVHVKKHRQHGSRKTFATGPGG